MHGRVQEQVGQHLPEGSRVAVHCQIGLALDVERHVALAQARSQAHENLPSQIAGIEQALIRIASIRRDLLERLDQFGGAIEVGSQLRAGVARRFNEVVQVRLLEVTARDFLGEHLPPPLQRRGHGYGDAYRIVDLVRNPGHQTPERCVLLRFEAQSMLRSKKWSWLKAWAMQIA